ncbi:MAG: hypothetical protein ACLTSZ_09715 [Lachnospiraceae bacterium]
MEYENIIFDVELLGSIGDLCVEKYLLPLQSGRLALPKHITPDEAWYSQAASCLREAEEASRCRQPGYELRIKGALLLFLALLIAQSKALPPAEKANTQRLRTRTAVDLGSLQRACLRKRMLPLFASAAQTTSCAGSDR